MRRRPGGGSPRSGCGSPATCTTASPTPWPPSTCRPAPPRTWSTAGPRRPRRRWRRSSGPAPRCSTSWRPCSTLLRDDGQQAERGADAGRAPDRRPGRPRCDDARRTSRCEVDGPVDDRPAAGRDRGLPHRPGVAHQRRPPRRAPRTPRVAVRVGARPWPDGRGGRRRRRRRSGRRTAAGWGSGACGSGPRRPAGASRPGPQPGGGFRCGRRGTAGRDPGRAGRRPAARAGRVPDAARRRGRHRRWSARPTTAPRPSTLVARAAARRRADGHPHARRRRPRGAAADHRRRRAGRASGCSCSPRSSSTSTCSRPCGSGPAASWSSTPSRPTSSAPCARSRPGRRCCRRA